MIRTLALDDEPLALEIIKSHCSKIPDVKLEACFTRVNDALAYLKSHPVDLLLLDIQMPQLTGLEFIARSEQQTLVIFTTAYAEFALDAFDLNAIDYLLKPIAFDRFEQAIRKALDYHQYLHQGPEAEPKYLYIKADYSLIKVNMDEILWVEALADYLRIHLPGNKSLVARMTMKSLTEKLPPAQFIRVHRSFILPVKRIKGIRQKLLVLDDGQTIPMGVSYEEKLIAQFGETGT